MGWRPTAAERAYEVQVSLPWFETARAEQHDVGRIGVEITPQVRARPARTLRDDHWRIYDRNRHARLQCARCQRRPRAVADHEIGARPRGPALDQRAAFGAIVLPEHHGHPRAARHRREIAYDHGA